MNTMTFPEKAAVALATASSDAVAVRPQPRLLTLRVLRLTKRNVRSGGAASIPELAASILRIGLLHNLVVVLSAMACTSTWWQVGGACWRSSCW